LLARPEIQQAVIDYRAGKPLPRSVTALSAPGTLDRFRTLSKSTGMSFADVAIGSAFPPSMPTRKPASSFQPFAQGGPLYQNPNAPGVDRGRALMAAQPASYDATSAENLFPYVASQFGKPPRNAFEQYSSTYIPRLMSDLGLTREQAAGVFGSLGAETGGFKYHQEMASAANPAAGKPGKGGIGWAQWTNTEGPGVGRRADFEAFAANLGLNVTDPEANYQFLVHELRTTEAAALDRLRSAETVSEAASAFDKGFLRPGVPHTSTSIKYGNSAFNYSGSAAGVNWGDVQKISDVPAGAHGLSALTSSPDSLAYALNPTGAPASAAEMARVSPIGGMTPSSIGGTRATPSSFAPLSTSALGGVGATPSSFAPSSTISLPANAVTQALRPNATATALGPNATARPLPSGTVRQGVAPVATAPAPVRMPTVSMPAQPVRPVSPGETYGSVPPGSTLNALPPSRTLTALSPGATLSALPPNLTAKPVAPTTLAAAPPQMQTASNPFSKPLAASGATTPLTASNPFSTVSSVAASLSPSAQPVPVSPPQLSPPPTRSFSSGFSSAPLSRPSAAMGSIFPMASGATYYSPTLGGNLGFEMKTGYSPFSGNMTASAQWLDIASSLNRGVAALHDAAARVFNEHNPARYGHEMVYNRTHFDGGAQPGLGSGGSAGGAGTNAININSRTAGTLAAQRRALLYGR
jgi:hypothetical protein